MISKLALSKISTPKIGHIFIGSTYRFTFLYFAAYFISQYPLFVEPFRSSFPIFLSFSISRYINDSLTFNNLDILSLEILLFFFISSRTCSCLVVITSSASFLASFLASFSAPFLHPFCTTFRFRNLPIKLRLSSTSTS